MHQETSTKANSNVYIIHYPGIIHTKSVQKQIYIDPTLIKIADFEQKVLQLRQRSRNDFVLTQQQENNASGDSCNHSSQLNSH